MIRTPWFIASHLSKSTSKSIRELFSRPPPRNNHFFSTAPLPACFSVLSVFHHRHLHSHSHSRLLINPPRKLLPTSTENNNISRSYSQSPFNTRGFFTGDISTDSDSDSVSVFVSVSSYYYSEIKKMTGDLMEDNNNNNNNNHKKKNSRHRARGGGGGGGGRDRRELISKALSTLLRHQAHNAGIPLDEEGYASLDKVMEWPRLRTLNPTIQEIKQEVSTNAKQRFSLKLKTPIPNPDSPTTTTNPTTTTSEEEDDDDNDPSNYLIRANQGHSITLSSEALHKPITLEAGNTIPPLVVHGTYFAFWPAILESGGLKKMGRTHVHFATGLPDTDTAVSAAGQVHDETDENAVVVAAGRNNNNKSASVVSGMRADAELLIFIDVEKALRENKEIKWWMSENNVVLSEGNADGLVPLEYFKEVRGRRQGVGVLWKDGEKVADLPDDIVAHAPRGKGRGGGQSGRGGGRGRGRGRG
ncbi:KptA family-domain-containing protein [Poronia punctata]|nr:KptA family-domain-containing protein [Poronia punctata]